MATTTGGSGNLVDEFEESFLSIMQVLTKEEENFTALEKDDVRVDIEQTTTKFLDTARQLEAFFLQKRFLLSTLKPELIIDEEIADLRSEIQRKDELIKRHSDKIAAWQNLLAEGWAKSPGFGLSQSAICTTGPSTSATPSPGGTSPNPILANVMQQQLHQQMQQQQQQMHQQMQQMQQSPQQQIPVGMSSVVTGSGMPTGPGPMMSPQHAMFMQQHNMGQRVSPFPTTGPAGCLPGPLAFLEKTTSNIGIADRGS